MSEAGPVLVTGARGFLGQHLVAHLRRKGVVAHEWVSDIRAIPQMKEPSRAVVHLAAVTDPDRFRRDLAEAYSVNVLGTLAVMEYCRQTGASCVLASTCGVYKTDAHAVPLRETAIPMPSGPYAISKLLAEQIAAAYASQHSLNITVLRLFNVYGSGQRNNFLIPEFLECLIEGNMPVIRTPNSVRDFIFIDDVVEAFLLAIERCPTGYRIYNIGSGKGITVSEAARTVARVFETTGLRFRKEGVESEVAGDVVDVSIADISRAESELNWNPRYTLEDGLRAMRGSTAWTAAGS